MTRTNANIAGAVWDAAARTPDRVALRDLSAGRDLTYTALRDAAGAFAAGLAEDGVRPGDRVALLLHNSCEYVVAFVGALAAGAVVVPLNTRLTVADFDHMLTDSGATLLVTETSFLADLRARTTIDLPRLVDVTGRTDGVPSLEDVSRASDLTPHHADAADVCSLMYTSGTTGAPKAVMLSHGAWSSVSDTASDLLGFPDGVAVMHPAPLTHGAGFLFLPTVRSGGVNLLVRGYDAAQTAELLRRGEAHGLFLVPSMIRMLLDVLPDDWSPHPDFRWLYYAGSPIDAPTFLEATRRFDARLVQSFAQMEAPMFLTSLGSAEHRRAAELDDPTLARSAGRLIPGREIRVVDDHGADVPTGEVGEVWGRAPQVMLGYWNRPEATASTLDQGWLHTGDMGRVDEAGHLYLVDRVKDMIVTGGSNVYAREVEEVLVDAPGVGQAAVVGLPHRVWGEEVTAVVVLADGARADEDEVLAFCRARLAGYKAPKRVVWVDALPRNAYGKVLKRQLRADLQGPDGTASPA
ncbi:AMP-binding protein [Aeromicrobium sp.]|uniref:class I adenylate-forming enzyme family protein n=1 Tax=Aeromicrobium sp. TaxID=1871063 RepID=UPI0025BABFDF|nr:AMP-binding protein [Aeromicrobium sp.]MCK5892608.1 AMP-binding protein [Aeromicrobium sp.]